MKKNKLAPITIGEETQHYFKEWMDKIFEDWEKSGSPNDPNDPSDPFKVFAKTLENLFIGKPLRFPMYTLDAEQKAKNKKRISILDEEFFSYSHYGILKKVSTKTYYDEHLMVIKFHLEKGNCKLVEHEWVDDSYFIAGDFPADDIKSHWGKYKKDPLLWDE